MKKSVVVAKIVIALIGIMISLVVFFIPQVILADTWKVVIIMGLCIAAGCTYLF
jgi:hypothetical protein